MSAPGFGDRVDHEHRLEAARTALGDAAFAAACSEGEKWPMEQAIAYALAPDPFEAGSLSGPPISLPA
jgi:hypothetical protein